MDTRSRYGWAAASRGIRGQALGTWLVACLLSLGGWCAGPRALAGPGGPAAPGGKAGAGAANAQDDQDAAGDQGDARDARDAQEGAAKAAKKEKGGTGEESRAGPYPLQTVIVTATRTPEETFDLPVSVGVAGKREIRERQLRTPAEALRYKPGIWVQKTGHLGGSPILRGFMGNRVIYLFDGIRRNTAGLFKGPNSFLQNVDALDMDRVEVVRGPGSVLYGSDAIGGVVNVITNEVPEFTPQVDWGGRILARYASVDQESSGRVEGHVSTKDFYGFAGITRRHISDVEGGRGVGTQSPSGWRESDWDAQADWRLGDLGRLEVFVQDFSRPNGRRFDRPNWRQDNDRKLYGTRLHMRDLGPVSDLEVTTYYHDQANFIDEKFWDSDSQDKTIGGEIQASSDPTDELHLTYGVHFHHDDIEKSNPQNGTEDPDVTWDNPAAFLLSEWQALPRLRLDAGVRWDFFSFDSDAPPLFKLDPAIQSAIANDPSFSLSSLGLHETDQAWTGGVGATVGITDHVNLVGHVGRAFRAPNKSDMLSFGQFTFGVNVPSPNLDPESSWTYELGTKMAYEDFALSLAGFYTVVKDAITSAPGTFGGSNFIDIDGNGVQDPGEQVFVKTNSPDDLVVHGVELEGKSFLPREWTQPVAGSHPLSLFGNFSWILGKDKGQNEPLDRAFPANALIGIRLDDRRDPSESRFWTSLEGWLVRRFDRIPSTRSGDPAFLKDPQDKTSGPLRADGSVPGFSILNLRGGLRINDAVNLTVGIENLTNKRYRVKDSRIDGPGTSVVLGLEIRV